MRPTYHNKKNNNGLKLSSILLLFIVSVGVWILFAFSHISTSHVAKEFPKSNDQVINKVDTKQDVIVKSITVYNKKEPSISHHGFKYILRNHPILLNKHRNFKDIVDILLYLSNTDQCRNQPVIVTMAHVGSELYWQLYVYVYLAKLLYSG